MEPKDYISTILNNCQKPVEFNDLNKEIMKPYDYIVRKPHKVTKAFIKAVNYWYRLPDDTFKLVEEISELYCESFCMIDEIIDESRIVRNEPATYLVHGLPQTLTCIEYINYLLFEKIVEFNNAEILRTFIQSGKDINKTEAVEVYKRNNSICPTFAELIAIGNGKSTAYFWFLFTLIRILSGKKEDKMKYKRTIDLLGVFLMIQNDFGNLFMKENESTYEEFADDLSEGVFSFPLVHAIGTLHNQEVADILKKRPRDLETKRRCVRILKEIGTYDFCLKVLKEFAELLKEEIRKVGGNPLMEKLVDDGFNFESYWG